MKTITKMKGLILLLMAVVLHSSAYAEVFKAITSASDLIVGAEYLIVCEKYNMALSEQNKDFRKNVAVTIKNNEINTNVNGAGLPYTLVLGGSTDQYTLFDATENCYLALTENENKLHKSTTANNKNAQWKISFTSNGIKIINCQRTNRHILYNSKSPRFACYTGGQAAVRLYKKIESTKIAPPTISHPEGFFSKAFDLIITAEEGCNIKYTTDGTEPTKDKGNDYSSPITISATTTVNAIAIKGDQVSPVTTATYTFVVLEGEGTLEKPYTIDDIAKLNENTEGWFKGVIKGSYEYGGHVATSAKNTNLAVGDDNTLIPVALPKGDIQDAVNVKDHPDFVGKEIIFYGNKKEYFSNPNGIQGTKQVYGLWNLNITEAGYSTYFTNHAFVVPAGVEVGIVIGVEGNALTIDWTKYSTGKTVPANTGVLVKGNKGDYPYVIVNSSAQTPANNLLKGSVAAEQTAGADCKFYKLSMDNSSKNLGFYWGAENGAAFENAANKAYLAVPNAVAANLFGFVIEGDGTTGIESVEQTQKLVDVYTIDGMLVQKQVKANQALNGLRKGIYIVNGKKVIK